MSTEPQLREDLLKLAINFLSSPKVQTADKEKKITFLKSKGLTDAEITEAFKRNDQQNTTTATTTTTSDNIASTSLGTSPSTTTSSTSSSSIDYTPPPTSLIPEKPLEPLIIYQPAPEPEKVPTSQVLAMSIIFGIGMTGIASTFIGIVKRLFLPIFSTYTGYKHSRYLSYLSVIEKLQTSIDTTIKEEKDQDELDTLDKPGVYQLVTVQQSLADRISKIVSQVQTLRSTKSSYKSSTLNHHLRQSLNELSETLSDISNEEEPDIVKGMKGELRSLKGMCLNRR